MSMTLKEVLDRNPFNKEVVERWKQDLDAFNKGDKQRSELNFVLDGDLRCVKGDVREKLHTELLPKPFMGHPSAPVWYLPINPSYSDIDLYDNLGICPDCDKELDTSHEERHRSCQIWNHLDLGRDRVGALVERQRLLLRQLRLENDYSFTFLEKVFDTLGDCSDRNDNGGYRWWQRRLFGRGYRTVTAEYLLKPSSVLPDASLVGGKLFALESFPYHSKRFNVKYYTSSAYFAFWTNLVKWGIENGKKFIVRARNKKFCELVSYAGIKFDAANAVKLSSDQNACITLGNLKGSDSTIAAIRQLLG